MREFTDRALDVARAKGATYADIRIVRRETQTIETKNGVVENLSLADGCGFGVRVVADGAWGFASSSRLEKAEIDRVAALAVAIAKASAISKRTDVDLGPAEVHVGTYRTPVKTDPFEVSLETKIDYLMRADKEARAVPGIRVVEGTLGFQRETKTFASTEGSYIEQVLVESGAGNVVMAVSEGEMQQRSYPNSFGRHQGTGGYEFIETWDLPGNARRIAEEAVALLAAPQCPSGVKTIILDGPQLGLQIHESCGHPSELDRVFGTEAAFAGTSFLTPDKYRTLRYGSDLVNIVSDAVTPSGLGTYGYDDEGVKTKRWDLVKDGTLVNYQAIRDQVHILGEKESHGCCYADSWSSVQFQRMANVSLAPAILKIAGV